MHGFHWEPTVELLLSSCAQPSQNIEHDDVTQTSFATDVVLSGTDGWAHRPNVRNLVKLRNRNHYGEIMSQKNFTEIWKSNNSTSKKSAT